MFMRVQQGCEKTFINRRSKVSFGLLGKYSVASESEFSFSIDIKLSQSVDILSQIMIQ